MASAFNDHDANEELWRECASWLTRWEMLRADHKVNLPNATIADFAQILRDGVLLCRLLNKIFPGCIDMKEVNLKPSMAQFLCLTNIKTFIKTCKDVFKLKQSEMFEPEMLFELTDFHKVLCSLSKLSLTPYALKKGINGFVAQRTTSKEDEDIYFHLHSVEMTKVPMRTHVNPDYDKSSEDTYEDLCVVRKSFEPQQLTMEKRDFVIKELLDTEKNYVEVLAKLRDNFMIPLSSILDKPLQETFFHKIHELHEIHYSFYKDMVRLKSDPKLSTIFFRWKERFLVYGSYCANLNRATTKLTEMCETNEAFNKKIIALEEEDSKGRFKLRDILSVPMQRILRYHLLLEKLIENTDTNHKEWENLKKAREAMLDVASYINEVTRDSDQKAVIRKIQDSITNWDSMGELRLADYGRLLMDGDLKVKPHSDQKTKPRYVFFFEKCILFCKHIKLNQFAFRELLNITEYRIDNINNRVVLGKDARWVYQFLLVKADESTSYTIYVRTMELKQKLINTFNEAYKALCPGRSNLLHNFELTHFPNPVSCKSCDKYLKGLFFQGYKCTTCNIAVHKECTQSCSRCSPFPHLPRSSSGRTSSSSSQVDDNLQKKLWFVGEMDRQMAQKCLENRENGTYLVRIRPKSDHHRYALTLKTDNSLKHMKIDCKDEKDSVKYYLSLTKLFNSVEELVLYYQTASLKENFVNLDENTTLKWPYRQLQALVIKSFNSSDDSYLNINEGSYIRIIDTDCHREGWFKAINENNEVGIFPGTHVRIEGDVSFN